MTEDGMRNAVIAHLVERSTRVGGDRPARPGWSSSLTHEGASGADPATIEFVKSKAFPTFQLHEVDHINDKGWEMHGLIKTWQDDEGKWKVHPLGGGAGPHPHRSQPWVNFCASFGSESFTGGGHVVGDGAEKAVTVRISFAYGIVVNDSIENGVVLFHEARHVVCPAEVAILGDGGVSLVEYEEFSEFAP